MTERFCCDGECAQGRDCPQSHITTPRGGWWLMAGLVTLPWIVMGCVLMAIRSCT